MAPSTMIPRLEFQVRKDPNPENFLFGSYFSQALTITDDESATCVYYCSIAYHSAMLANAWVYG